VSHKWRERVCLLVGESQVDRTVRFDMVNVCLGDDAIFHHDVASADDELAEHVPVRVNDEAVDRSVPDAVTRNHRSAQPDVNRHVFLPSTVIRRQT
jgi:hypothetical protein